MVGDFNGDRLTDLGFLSSGANTLRTAYATPGGWTAFNTVATQVTNSVAHAVVLDLNGDRIHDIALVSGTGVVGALFGSGPRYQPSSWLVDLNRAVTSVRAADVNHDGLDDLVLATGTTTIRTLLSRGPNTPAEVMSDLMKIPEKILLADLDQDAYLDLVTVVDGGTRLMMYRGLGLGRFGLGTELLSGLPITAVATSDHNADGLPDLMLISGTSLLPLSNCSK